MVVTIGARLGWQLAKACLQHRDRLGGIEKAVRIPSRRRRQLGVTATRGFCRWDRRWRIARLTTALPPRRQAARAIKFYRQDGPCWDPVRNRPPHEGDVDGWACAFGFEWEEVGAEDLPCRHQSCDQRNTIGG